MVEKLQSIFGQGIPILNAVLIAVWLVGTTITLTLQWSSVKSSISGLSSDFVLMNERIMNRILMIETREASRWTRENHELWCAKTEQQNQNWKCGEFPRPFKEGSLEYWDDRARGIAPLKPKDGG